MTSGVVGKKQKINEASTQLHIMMLSVQQSSKTIKLILSIKYAE